MAPAKGKQPKGANIATMLGSLPKSASKAKVISPVRAVSKIVEPSPNVEEESDAIVAALDAQAAPVPATPARPTRTTNASPGTPSVSTDIVAIDTLRDRTKKRALELVKAETVTSEDKSPAAERAAKRRRLTDGQKKALEEIQEYLLSNPDSICDTRSNLLNGGCCGAVKRPSRKDKDNFDASKTKIFKQVPKHFLNEQLVAHARFDSSELDAMDSKDNCVSRKLAAFLFGIVDGTVIPSVLKGDKRLISALLGFRYVDLGSRETLFRTKEVCNEDFTLDWNGVVWGHIWTLEPVQKIRVSFTCRQIRSST